jgi:hypothetical protein
MYPLLYRTLLRLLSMSSLGMSALLLEIVIPLGLFQRNTVARGDLGDDLLL